jgi:hypothetical protein
VIAWLRAKIASFGCAHTAFTLWHPVRRYLIGPLGATVDDVQQRECVACGFIQRVEITSLKETHGL